MAHVRSVPSLLRGALVQRFSMSYIHKALSCPWVKDALVSVSCTKDQQATMIQAPDWSKTALLSHETCAAPLFQHVASPHAQNLLMQECVFQCSSAQCSDPNKMHVCSVSYATVCQTRLPLGQMTLSQVDAQLWRSNYYSNCYNN